MSENNPENQNSEEKEESNVQESETTESPEKEQEVKTKFTFKCTRCDSCCLSRGPIPITFWDLEMWAKNGVVANFMPYLDIYQKPDGSIDLILKPLPPPKEEEGANLQQDPFATKPIEELLEVKCSLYNKEDKKCLIYDNRPLSCRTYPLEFDGKNFIVVDADCPGIGEEGMSKEDLIQMRETAKTMHYELTRMRIALPVLNQIVSSNFMQMLMRQQMEAMSKMSDDDKSKLDEIFKKQEPEHDHEHDHDQEP
ncbi:MAG: YkgJ family cysteine cluster protein [Candidatus Lokiarchaeota archaeon]|nr:YkgJ family cysteine cluster protein [Candidatus Lokiarchaeota archaeon]